MTKMQIGFVITVLGICLAEFSDIVTLADIGYVAIGIGFGTMLSAK